LEKRVTEIHPTGLGPIPAHPPEIPPAYLQQVQVAAEARLLELFPDATGVRSPGSCGTCISAEAVWHGCAVLVHHPRCIARPGIGADDE
jgi:hypothetical protein